MYETFCDCSSIFSLSFFNFLNFLTLNLGKFLREIIHLPFLQLSIISFRDIKMRGVDQLTVIEPGQTAHMAGLAL